MKTGKYSSGLSEARKRKIRNASDFYFADGKFWHWAEADNDTSEPAAAVMPIPRLRLRETPGGDSSRGEAIAD